MKIQIAFFVGILAFAGCASSFDSTKSGKTLVLVAEENPLSSSLGEDIDTGNRPDSLVPGKIPKGVRYEYASDGEVVDAATLLGDALRSDDSVFGDFLMVNPGAWYWFRSNSKLGKTDSTALRSLVPMGNKTMTLEGAILRNRGELDRLHTEWAALLGSDGGFRIRSLMSKEMAEWWPFIAFDIQEPIFVVESENEKFRFIVHFSDGKISNLDELNSLN